MNRAIYTSLAAIGTAQALKIPGRIGKKDGLSWYELLRPGGMPSSHTAGVASLATYIALKKGTSNFSFALASLLGLIVMYDAMGIRRQAGLIATEVNELKDSINKLMEQRSETFQQKEEKELEERLGHLPVEVMGGAVLGIIIGWLSYATDASRFTQKSGDLFTLKWLSRFVR